MNISFCHHYGDRALSLITSYWMPSTSGVYFYGSYAEAEGWQAGGRVQGGHCLQDGLWALRPEVEAQSLSLLCSFKQITSFSGLLCPL